jgi:hypothetical protein
VSAMIFGGLLVGVIICLVISTCNHQDRSHQLEEDRLDALLAEQRALIECLVASHRKLIREAGGVDGDSGARETNSVVAALAGGAEEEVPRLAAGAERRLR